MAADQGPVETIKKHRSEEREVRSVGNDSLTGAPPGIVPRPVYGCRLETQQHKGGIPTSAPRRLASSLLRLPPILYMHCRIPVPN